MIIHFIWQMSLWKLFQLSSVTFIVKDVCKKYVEKLLNGENSWDTTCEKVEGPFELIRNDESLKALRVMNMGEAAGPTGVVTEMIMADENLGVEWLTDLCNLIVAEGRIREDWKVSILLPAFKEKGNPMECGSYRAVKLLEHSMKVIECVFERKSEKRYQSMKCSLVSDRKRDNRLGMHR